MSSNATDPARFINRAPATPERIFAIVAQAVAESATDVHIDTFGAGATVRFRVDGLVHPKLELTPDDGRRLLNQLKVAADLDIENVHKPLEGQFRWSSGERTCDVRVTIIPSAPRYEAAHLRLLDSANDRREIEDLGLCERDRVQVERVIQSPHGLLLMAGPTGSGKTTTQYALASRDSLSGQIIASIEDPAEFDLPFVRQLEVNARRGLRMEEGLRYLLRMDADVLMVGEIRDQNSARIAAQAALAGRLVMATVHGRDAAGAVEAMHYLSVPYHILGSALRMVIAQNLVRKVCPHCVRRRDLQPHERVLFEDTGVVPPDQVGDPVGCDACIGYGYRGRTGIFEVGVVDDDFGLWLTDGPRQQEVRQRLVERGTTPLAADALRKVAGGITTMREVLRFFGQGVDRPAIVPPTSYSALDPAATALWP